jgi:para-nitrobenzyl esterase
VVEQGAVVFRGVPYGRAERFRRATAFQRWDGERDASALGAIAVQAPAAGRPAAAVPTDIAEWFAGPGATEQPALPQSEDCLVLNVTTPALDGTPRPVMVYVHGGGFSGGSGSIGGSPALASEQDVVLVSVNHRLNVFGFLHLDSVTDAFPDAGNAGMLDLVLSLEWVRDNITSFGGDPGNVTVYGESGGGAKISTLMAMPAAAGLFHKAIVQSGSFVEALEPDEAAAGVRRLLGAVGGNVDALLALGPEDLWRAATEAGVIAMPVVDGRALPRHPFAPDAPPQSESIPLVVGHCLDETSMFAPFVNEAELKSQQGLSDEHLQVLIGAYRAAYPDVDDARLRVRIMSDATFTRSVWDQVERKAAQPAAVYRYVFTYEPPVMGRALGAFHTAELGLVQRQTEVPEAKALSERLSGAWAAFARTGDPSLPDLPWPAYELEERRAMRFDLDAGAIPDPDRALRDAWGHHRTRGLKGLLMTGVS